MSRYLVTFKPSGKYFFGNEKGFDFNGKNDTYFIRSDRLPLQTTVFGALRFLLLPEKGFEAAKKYADIIGAKSFNIEAEGQSFGVIKGISPVFLVNNDEWFIPTPFDHDESTDGDVYTPFTDYERIQTLDGEKLFTSQYNAKLGTADSFMSLSDCRIEDSLFSSSVQVGINRRNTQDGFFKREYILLKDGFSFAVIADIDDDGLDGRKDAALLGQCKTAFAVCFKKYDGESPEKLASRAILSRRGDVNQKSFIYFMSDFYLGEQGVSGLYSNFLFAITNPRYYRSFMTEGSSVVKGGKLHRLIRAGSFAIPSESFDYELTEKQKNAATVGFNHLVSEKE